MKKNASIKDLVKVLQYTLGDNYVVSYKKDVIADDLFNYVVSFKSVDGSDYPSGCFTCSENLSFAYGIEFAGPTGLFGKFAAVIATFFGW